MERLYVYHEHAAPMSTDIAGFCLIYYTLIVIQYILVHNAICC